MRAAIFDSGGRLQFRFKSDNPKKRSLSFHYVRYDKGTSAYNPEEWVEPDENIVLAPWVMLEWDE